MTARSPTMEIKRFGLSSADGGMPVPGDPPRRQNRSEAWCTRELLGASYHIRNGQVTM